MKIIIHQGQSRQILAILLEKFPTNIEESEIWVQIGDDLKIF